MEIIGGILASLVIMVLLAGLGLATAVALALMALLGLLTEFSFKRIFFVSFGVGLLAPLLLGGAIVGAFQDGSLERDLRDELGQIVQLPEDVGGRWSEVLPQLQEVSREVDSGNLTEEEAEARVEAILADFEDLQITIDVNGDGTVLEGAQSGVPLELPEAVEADRPQGDGGNE